MDTNIDTFSNPADERPAKIEPSTDAPPVVRKLSALDPRAAANKGAAVIITNPDGEPTGEVIYIRGRLSDIAEKLQRAADVRQQQNYKKYGKLTFLAPAEAKEEKVLYAAALTIGWDNISDLNGAPRQFSANAARDLYEFNALILEQVDKGIANDALFLKA